MKMGAGASSIEARKIEKETEKKNDSIERTNEDRQTVQSWSSIFCYQGSWE